MKRLLGPWIPVLTVLFLAGCMQPKVDPDLLDSPDEKALHDLMVARCRALSEKDLALFEEIYTRDSPELEWIREQGIPMWRQWGVRFRVWSVKRLSILGDDAAGRFVLNGNNRYGKQFVETVEALFVRRDGRWKIESTGAL